MTLGPDPEDVRSLEEWGDRVRRGEYSAPWQGVWVLCNLALLGLFAWLFFEVGGALGFIALVLGAFNLWALLREAWYRASMFIRDRYEVGE